MALTAHGAVWEKRWDQRKRAAVFCASRPQFLLADLAAHMKLSAAKTEALLGHLLLRRKIEVVFHDRTRTYVHAARVGELSRQSPCPGCGAPTAPPTRLDEPGRCDFCGRHESSAAPAAKAG